MRKPLPRQHVPQAADNIRVAVKIREAHGLESAISEQKTTFKARG
jgi:hypothetical protein